MSIKGKVQKVQCLRTKILRFDGRGGGVWGMMTKFRISIKIFFLQTFTMWPRGQVKNIFEVRSCLKGDESCSVNVSKNGVLSGLICKRGKGGFEGVEGRGGVGVWDLRCALNFGLDFLG